MQIRFKKIRAAAILPAYQTPRAAAFDLAAAEEVAIAPRSSAVVGTGWAIQLPPDTELQIRPRSGLSLKSPLFVKNSPGTIDEDYRGEVGVILYNCGDEEYLVRCGDRIAQGLLAPLLRCSDFAVVDELDETTRGSGGFGHTGQ